MTTAIASHPHGSAPHSIDLAIEREKWERVRPELVTTGSGKEQNMTYVDGFVVAVPKAKVAEYTEFSRRAGEVWKEHGHCSMSSASPTTCPMAS